MTAESSLRNTVEDIETHLGEPCRLSRLHPWYVHIRRKHAHKSLALPTTYQVLSNSGRLFKLHVGGATKLYTHIVTRVSDAVTTELFPSIVWRSERALLVDYLAGEVPDFSSEHFAIELGQGMARLHSVKKKPCDFQRVARGVSRDVALLKGAGLLGAEVALLLGDFEQFQPAGLMASMDYSDVKPANFLLDKNGKLRFIDLGAVRANRPAGQYLCGSLYLRKLNRERFAESYLEAGGLSQVVEQARYLRMLNCIWAAALNVRKMRDVSVLFLVHKLGYWLLARHYVQEFSRLAGIDENHIAKI